MSKTPREPIFDVRLNAWRVPLTGGAEALVDSEDVDRVRGRCWHLHAVSGKPKYARGRFHVEGLVVRVYMHRFLFDLNGGAQVDHKDGNGLNNCRSNLRAATQTQQNANRRIRRDSASGLRGVQFDRERRTWRAYIGAHSKTFLGRFTTARAAGVAYDDAARKRYGARATLNFPRSGERGCR